MRLESKSNFKSTEEVLNALTRYQYEPLRGSDNIRILTLHATEDHIECSLQQIDVSDGGYQALSYVWGNPAKPFRAIVRGDDGSRIGYIPLTANLKDAFGDLRDAEGLQSKVFWIDQICIDQEGDEKNHQVAMMGAIYKNSARVITYIGPSGDDEEEKAAMKLLARLYEHFEENYEFLFKHSSLSEVYRRKSEFPVKELPKELQYSDDERMNFRGKTDEDAYVVQGWRRLFELAFGKWTERLWIVQEQLLNSETSMLRGPLLLPWDTIPVMAMLFFSELFPNAHYLRFNQEYGSQSYLAPGYFACSLYSIWYNRKKLNTLKPRIAGGPDELFVPTLSNMAFYQGLICHDPRDRIYGLLAISSDAKELGIISDYSVDRTASSVYLDFSVRVLQRWKDLELLAYASRWSNPSDITVPSWAINIPPLPLPDIAPYGVLAPHAYSSLEIRPRFILDYSVVVLKGRVIDYIAMSASPVETSRSFEVGVLDAGYLRSVTQVLSGLSNVLFHLGITLENACSLCRAIMALDPAWSPALHEKRSPIEQTVFHLLSLYRYLLSVISRASDICSATHITEDCVKVIQELAGLLKNTINVDVLSALDELSLEEKEANAEVYRHQVIRARSFCVTKQNLICNGMHEVQEGDAIAALQGAERLYILRPVGDRYRLVGDAFIPGLNFGEAYEGLDPDEVDYDIEIM
ncbi:uncharacterized protein LY89DRAFT_670297 [Mollisia scopiformis]|uniref:Heterokaryon incompatibility domain-containing protein n=1 Tax=Mollisia scopiformis TaxID=149040 RepID=A0A194X6E7_MOLSC|nr:uncharacterized protein LY89DRAFT_670297 [Mollisia scopiformis]KUJ15753.1 hypothetical protein LY89DRAFT_670297 [Mollisia scopiformis]